MNRDFECVKLAGTQKEIAEKLRDRLDTKFNIDGTTVDTIVENFLTLGAEHYDILSEDESFTKIEPIGLGNEGFITGDAKYFINLKKGSLMILLQVANTCIPSRAKIPAAIVSYVIKEMLKAFVPDINLEQFYPIEAYLGESCILLEAARNRKKGIDKKYFSKFNGECVNHQLSCVLRGDCCQCTPEKTKEICEKLVESKVLTKRGNSYYYTDII